MAVQTHQTQKESIFSLVRVLLKEHWKFFIILSLIFLFLYTFLYGFWRIPLLDFGISRMTAFGVSDYLFVLFISPLLALFVALFRYERKNKFSRLSSASTFGGLGGSIGGFIAGICPMCQGIVLVAFGGTLFNIQTAALIPYLGVIKIVSFGLLLLAVVVKADSICKQRCLACEILTRK